MFRRLQEVRNTPSGSGHINIFAFGNNHIIGGGIDYRHRINERWAAVASAEISKAVGNAQGNGQRFNSNAQLGLSYKF